MQCDSKWRATNYIQQHTVADNNTTDSRLWSHVHRRHKAAKVHNMRGRERSVWVTRSKHTNKKRQQRTCLRSHWLTIVRVATTIARPTVIQHEKWQCAISIAPCVCVCVQKNWQDDATDPGKIVYAAYVRTNIVTTKPISVERVRLLPTSERNTGLVKKTTQTVREDAGAEKRSQSPDNHATQPRHDDKQKISQAAEEKITSQQHAFMCHYCTTHTHQHTQLTQST